MGSFGSAEVVLAGVEVTGGSTVGAVGGGTVGVAIGAIVRFTNVTVGLTVSLAVGLTASRRVVSGTLRVVAGAVLAGLVALTLVGAGTTATVVRTAAAGTHSGSSSPVFSRFRIVLASERLFAVIPSWICERADGFRSMTRRSLRDTTR